MIPPWAPDEQKVKTRLATYLLILVVVGEVASRVSDSAMSRFAINAGLLFSFVLVPIVGLAPEVWAKRIGNEYYMRRGLWIFGVVPAFVPSAIASIYGSRESAVSVAFLGAASWTLGIQRWGRTLWWPWKRIEILYLAAAIGGVMLSLFDWSGFLAAPLAAMGMFFLVRACLLATPVPALQVDDSTV